MFVCYVWCILTYDYRVILQLVFWKADLCERMYVLYPVFVVFELFCHWSCGIMIILGNQFFLKADWWKSWLIKDMFSNSVLERECLNPLPDKPYVLCFGICSFKCQEDWWPILAGNIWGKKRTNNILVRMVAQERQTIPLPNAHHCA